MGKNSPIGGPVDDFDPLTITRKVYRMIADHIAPAKRMYPNFFARPNARMPSATMPLITLAEFPRLGDNLDQTLCCSARCIHLIPMMHLNDLRVEVFAQKGSRSTGEIKNHIYANGKIPRPDNGNIPGGSANPFTLLIAVPGGPDDHAFPVCDREVREPGCSMGRTEIDYDVT